ncbi:hypothetical protein EVI01_18700 [Enterococcus villorum]|uniref:Uncharacterized protein n=1 Tax=Enterococcus villorum TaxID=112904 RepID=A0A511J4A1_9ENTE|nr:hypothetical protein EVI01_18700 [Enterococcus villorum]
MALLSKEMNLSFLNSYAVTFFLDKIFINEQPKRFDSINYFTESVVEECNLPSFKC